MHWWDWWSAWIFYCMCSLLKSWKSLHILGVVPIQNSEPAVKLPPQHPFTEKTLIRMQHFITEASLLHCRCWIQIFMVRSINHPSLAWKSFPVIFFSVLKFLKRTDSWFASCDACSFLNLLNDAAVCDSAAQGPRRFYYLFSFSSGQASVTESCRACFILRHVLIKYGLKITFLYKKCLMKWTGCVFAWIGTGFVLELWKGYTIYII